MAIFKALTFDGVNSLDYGIYITGEAVYNAPERAVEMVNIPGKNGALALDQGRFENIEVTYHAGCFADNQADFADKVMKFRNALASRYTYKRLTDEYHPDEYRLGLYKSGLEVDAVRYSTAGEFNITFDCKPQRFLVDGDRAISPTEWSDVQTESGELVTIESDGSLAVKSLEVSLSPIQSGSGTPSPTNIRPISGRTEVVTQRTGKNLCDTSLVYNGFINISQRKIASNANARTLYLPCKPNTTYTVSKQAGQRFVVAESTELPTNNVVLSNVVSDYTASSITITTTASAKYLVAFVYLSTADTGVTADQMLATCQIELGTTATDYEPYQGTTYTTALGRTVYGGTLDVVSGKLAVTWVAIEPSPSSWVYDSGNGRWSAVLSPTPKPTGNNRSAEVIAEAYETNTSVQQGGIGCFRYSTSVFVYSNSSTTPPTGKFCYPLATPQTYQLTPQQIDLLLGANHLWSDGEITVEYGVHPYYNPTPFASKPLIKVTGTGTLGIGEYILTITGTASQTLYIDCETMEIYTIEGTVPTGASSLVSINKNDFPVLEPGTNYISVGSGITAVTITPRWWRI